MSAAANTLQKAWAIAPWKFGEPVWEDVWRFDYANNCISIGWAWLGNVIDLEEDEIKEQIKIKQPPEESDRPGSIVRQFRFFHHEVKAGHMILARKGRQQIVGLGIVADIAYFDVTKAKNSNVSGYNHPNFLPVRWIKDFRPIDYRKFRLRTVEPFEDQQLLATLAKFFKLEISDSEEDSEVSAIRDCGAPPIGSSSPDRAASVGWRYQRDNQVRRFVIEQAKGRCEYCGNLGFLLPDGGHYLEAHHVIALSNQGSDTVANVIALCPSDHREAHYGAKAVEIENEMIKIIKRRQC